MWQFSLFEPNSSGRGSRLSVFAAAVAFLVVSGCAGATGEGSGSNLTVDPPVVSFGDVSTGGSSTRSVTVTNVGAAKVSVSNVSISGAGFRASLMPVGLTLAPGDSVPLGLTFAPSSIGQVTGTVTITENVSSIPLAITLYGNGVTASAHSITLTWDASPSVNAVGYRAYRSIGPDGPYTPLHFSPNPELSWIDSTVQPGTTYYYVVTAVTADSRESVYCKVASATVPVP